MFRDRLSALRSDAETRTGRIWSGVDPTRIDETLPPVLAAVEAVVVGTQTEAARAGGLYVQTFLTSELDEVVDVPVDPFQYAGTTRDGRPVSDVLALASVSMKLARSAGVNNQAVSLAGLARTVRAVRTETVDAARRAQSDTMDRSGRVSGFYRATSGRPCGACLALAGRRFATDDVFPIHGACSCTAEPIVSGVPDRYAPPDGSRIFNDLSPTQANTIYGESTAEAIRNGDIDIDQLVQQHDAYRWGAMVSQRPLSKITG